MITFGNSLLQHQRHFHRKGKWYFEGSPHFMVRQNEVTRLLGPCLLPGPSGEPVSAMSMSTTNCKCAFNYLNQGLNRFGRPIPARGDCRWGLCRTCAVHLMPESIGFMGLNSACSFGHVLMTLETCEDALQTMMNKSCSFISWEVKQAPSGDAEESFNKWVLQRD